MKIREYKIIVFDCDGVILNSNKIKTEAFENSVRYLGDEAAKSLRNYHIQNGGISRYQKFQHFIDSLMPALGLNQTVDLNQLLLSYAHNVKKELLSCEIDKIYSILKILCLPLHGQ